MAIIFYFSSRPSTELPNFGWLDYLVKKGGHFTIYALLAITFWYALGWRRDRVWLAWLLAALYAVTDEFHQSFVPGRHPSVWDVVIFDTFGALIALWLAAIFLKRKRSGGSA